ncbi:aldehyde dehydrogenase, dimeric NADP-preferring-like isoform X2 [Liolophura sinensis]|uniref:aldehyde dehydrogenase, dimeric NADP-preferring-like isoform X2 n=1 Tax=Liolophura sinensis TaxID=3198878 RepID=UPI003159297D
MANYTELVSGVRKTFLSGKTKTLAWRRKQLDGILKILTEKKDDIVEALKKDLHKPKMETLVFEVSLATNEVINTMNNLEEWMKPEKVKKGLLNMMDTCYIRREPLGTVLILGAWNYPLQLTLLPLLGALAAGNCAILKPSEVAENTALLLEKLIPQYLDTECVKVVNGGVPETTALLKERFDHIFYTGNSMVAKIVMKAAAENLTPVTLELGGKSPVYIDRGCDLSVVGRRLMWGKVCNAGQTCVAPDYVLCPQDVQEPLIEKLKSALDEFYKGDPAESDDYGRIINKRHFERVKNLLGSGTVAFGGDLKPEELYISPTVIKDVKLDDPVMTNEIFGPLLPIVTVKNEDEAIDIINSREKPLALYVFSTNKNVVDKIVEQTSSGGFCVNDVMVHGGLETLPFGGVGHSGMGSYHGHHTFDTFSHKRACLLKDLKMDNVNQIRYPPYTEKKLSWITWIMQKKPKRSGILSFVPFLLLGTIFAVVFKHGVMRSP